MDHLPYPFARPNITAKTICFRSLRQQSRKLRTLFGAKLRGTPSSKATM